MRFFACFFYVIFLGGFSWAQEDLGVWRAGLKQDNDSVKIASYNELFRFYQYSNPDSATAYVVRGLQYFTEKKVSKGVAAMTTLLAMQDVAQGRIEIGRKRFASAMAIFEQIDNKRGMATVNNGLGVLDVRMANFSSATKHFLTALELFQSLGDEEGMANTYLKLGTVNEQSNNLKKALEYYDKAIVLTEKKPSRSTALIYIYNNAGIVYARMGNIAKAIDLFERALKGSMDKPEYLEAKILSYTNLGIAYDKLNLDAKALAYFDEGLALIKDRNMPEHYARLTVNKAAVVKKTNIKGAVALLNEALGIARNINQRNLMADIYDQQVDIYRQEKDFKSAYNTLLLQRSLEDSMLNVEKAKEIANLQSVHELEQSNARVNSLEVAGRMNLLKRNIIVSVAAGLAVSLILLSIFFNRSRRLNRALSQREADLKRSNDVKDKLFSIIGHDLRGPIGNIPVMLQLLNEESTTEDEKDYLLQTLSDHSIASKETLDKLLYWGQAQIKGVGTRPELFDTMPYADNNMKLIKRSAEQKQINVENQVTADTLIYADPAHFDFVIRNLLSNAVKFTHVDGKVVLSADKQMLPGNVVFMVHDTGIGIAQDKLEDIFKPVGNSTRGTADEKGTSIGLMLCKEFVAENGGRIWVESEQGKGSTFYVSFKAAA